MTKDTLADPYLSGAAGVHAIQSEEVDGVFVTSGRHMGTSMPKGPRRCVLCGGGEHSQIDCELVCRKCGMRRCPGARDGETYVVQAKDRPRDVRDALG